MRLKISKSKNAASLYVIKDVTINGKRTSKIVEKLGTVDELNRKLEGQDPIAWAKEYIKGLNQEEKEKKQKIMVKFSPARLINKNQQVRFNGGYLFLQKIYHDLKLHSICNHLYQKYKFTFDLNAVLSRLTYGRILFPSSKLATMDQSHKLIEQPNFDIQHIYRSLEILAKESDYIQSALYKNSLNITNRNTGVLFYDCTNFFFEIEQEDGLKQYGASKEHRPNPIVQMGLFMDGNGIPLAFSINKGNTNEQITLKPLEKKILKDFELSKFVVCTDAGLASQANRKYNSVGERAFITTQSIKKLKKYLQDWTFEPTGWRICGDDNEYDISKLEKVLKKSSDSELIKSLKDRVFYKERWIKENNFEQRLIVTFSFKYQSYQRNIRNEQIERAHTKIASNPSKISKPRQNDYRRFIDVTTCTDEGEIAERKIYSINDEKIKNEEKFDGFYGVCTCLEDDISEIVKINKSRWQIEECFRIMKSEFKARPVYLRRDDRIQAHFITCFISLIIYRILEERLSHKYTCQEITKKLRSMDFYEARGEGYIPLYERDDLTDDLHDKFGFRTDYQIVTEKNMKKIIKETKK